MALAAGSRIGPYEIVSAIGAGGMGEVYRARDTRLHRDVALKVLPDEVAADPDRLSRFEREARLLASLNHPNIAAIFGFEESGPTRALVLELVDGDTLALRLAAGALPLPDAIGIARQIATALDAAHEQGIVHRDLKPANITVSSGGVVKVLDFGIAKALSTAHSTRADLTATRTGDITRPGTVLGTAAYMSPEQTRGQDVDKRTDIWAFGCVLVEMLTGRRAFGGHTTSDISAAVLTRDAELSGLPSSTPPRVRRLIDRCLAKDPKQRARDIGDVLAELNEPLDPPAPAPARAGVRVRPFGWALAGGVVAIAVAAAATGRGGRFIGTSTRVGAVESLLPVTSFAGDERDPSFSPDGGQIAFSWTGDSGGGADLYVLQVGGQSPLRITSDPLDDRFPSWSPDGRQLAFIRRVSLSRALVVVVPALGGPERKLFEFPITADVFLGPASLRPAWTPDGSNLIVPAGRDSAPAPSLQVLSLETGQARPLFPDQKATFCDCGPVLSPDARWLAFAGFRAGPASADLLIQELGAGLAPIGDAIRVDDAGGVPRAGAWSPDSRRLLFAGDGRIVAWERGRPIASVYVGSDSLSGLTVAWRPGGASRIRVIASTGRRDEDILALPLAADHLATAGAAMPLARSMLSESQPRYSPDGRSLAFTSSRSGAAELWVADADGERPRQLTNLRAFIVGYPRWSPDSRRLVFHARVPREGSVYIVDTDAGVTRRVTAGTTPSWSSNGEWIYFDAPNNREVARVRPDGRDEIRLFRGVAAVETLDGRRLIYAKQDAPGIFARNTAGNIATNQEERLVEDYRGPFGGFVAAGSGIYYTGIAKDRPTQSFRFLDFGRRTSIDIAPVPQSLTIGLTVSPNERRLAFSTLQTDSGENLVMFDFAIAR